MLDRLFMQVLDLTRAASVVILLVLAARLALKKAPKAFSYVLWLVVLLRLLWPVSLPWPGVLEMESVSEGYTLAEESVSLLGATEAAYRAIGDALNGGLGLQHIRTTQLNAYGNVAYVTSSWWEVWVLFGQYVWLAVAVWLAASAFLKYIRLGRALRAAEPAGEDVWESDAISAPFVMGLLRPGIYLPRGLTPEERRCILAHERQHIRHLDHIVKLLFFIARCVHWFNPLVWAAFRQFEKDMEMRCDEAVIRKLDGEARADYAASLLRFSAGPRRVSGQPLAFGEGNVKERILNMAKWKEPGKRTRALAALFCAVILAAGAVLWGCGAEEPGLTGGIYKMETPVDTLIQPRISFNMEEQWFVFTYDPLSSYLSAGPFEIEDGVVTATTYDGKRSYTFEIVDSETIRYVQSGDVPLMAIDLTDGERKLAVPDGVLFKFSADYTQEVYSQTQSADWDPDAAAREDRERVHSDTSCTEPGCTDLAHYRVPVREYDLCTDSACADSSHHHWDHH